MILVQYAYSKKAQDKRERLYCRLLGKGQPYIMANDATVRLLFCCAFLEQKL